jgi:histidine phosphotransferase ChpT
MGDPQRGDSSGDSHGDALWVAECLCARLCHDLAGALGALMGSLELARDDEAMGREAIQLASATGQALVARLRLLRAAWVGEGMPLDLAHLAELAEGLTERRVTLDLTGLPRATMFEPAVGRVVLNLVLLGAEALPVGGTVWLEPAGPDLVLGIAGPRTEWPPGLAASLAGDIVIEGPRALQAPLTVLIARAAGFRLSLLVPAGTLGARETRLLLLGMKPGGMNAGGMQPGSRFS